MIVCLLTNMCRTACTRFEMDNNTNWPNRHVNNENFYSILEFNMNIKRKVLFQMFPGEFLITDWRRTLLSDS